MCVQAMLTEGMESMSQAKVGSALQIYFNLEELIEVESRHTRTGQHTHRRTRHPHCAARTLTTLVHWRC